MNTYAAKGTKATNETNTVSARQTTEAAPTAWLRQLAGLLDATMRETWLPMGFRAMVVHELPRMRAHAEKGSSELDLLLDVVSLLREEAEPYKAFAKRSAAFVTLRNLEAELKSFSIVDAS